LKIFIYIDATTYGCLIHEGYWQHGMTLNKSEHKQPTMVHHDYVVHAIHFFPPIKIAPMGHIVPMLMNFDEGSINKFNIALKL